MEEDCTEAEMSVARELFESLLAKFLLLAEDGRRDVVLSRGLGEEYKSQP